MNEGNDGKTIIPEGISIKPPGKEDLIYSEESPDYCTADRITGSLGTQGRVCNATSPGVDGCELLCCGRGYETHTTKTRVNCHCRFKWCCEVTCQTCTVKKHINTCRWCRRCSKHNLLIACVCKCSVTIPWSIAGHGRSRGSSSSSPSSQFHPFVILNQDDWLFFYYYFKLINFILTFSVYCTLIHI